MQKIIIPCQCTEHVTNLFKYGVLPFEKFNGVKKKSNNILLFFKKIQKKKKLMT
jgi:hypothetical protein